MNTNSKPGSGWFDAGVATNGITSTDPSRRRLLGTGAAALVGAMLTPALMAPAGASERPGGHAREPQRRTLLRGGTVLTMDRSVGDFAQADVLLEAGKIKAIERRLQVHDAELIDATGMIVMPGFVDGHRHLWMGLLKNSGPNDLLGGFLARTISGTAPFLTPDDVYISNLVSALGALRVGITTVLDWSHIGTTPAHTDAAILALQDSGMRAVFAYGANLGLNPPWYGNPQSRYPEDIRRLRKQFFASPDQLLTLALAATGPELAPMDAVLREWSLAREVGARISVHVGFGLLGTRGLLQTLSSKVALGSDTTYLHCNTLSDNEWQLIANTGGTVSIAPQVEMQMGHGMPPFEKMRRFGIRPSLSVDIETNQPGDMFTPMRAAFQLERAQVNEQNRFGGPEPAPETLFTVRDVLELATVEGARAHGLLSKVGTLTPGKDADVILLRARSINVAPVNDPVGAVVLGMDSSNVDSVFVAGRAVKRHGVMLGIDEQGLLRRAEKARVELLLRAGVKL